LLRFRRATKLAAGLRSVASREILTAHLSSNVRWCTVRRAAAELERAGDGRRVLADTSTSLPTRIGKRCFALPI